MQKAKDIMTKPVISVSEDQNLKEVLELLAKHSFSGVPVVDQDNKVIGIISDTDIIRYSQQVSVIPLSNLSGWISPYAEISDLASLQKGFNLLHKTSVGKVMTKKVYTIEENAAANEVAKLMNRRKINRIPIVDNSGKLVGIVTRADMVLCMANL